MTFQMAAQGKIETNGAAPPSVRFLRAAHSCRMRDLNQLLILSDLIKETGDLIHALQKERGASAGFVGSSGAQFCDLLAQRVADSKAAETIVRARLDHIDEQLDRMSSGARFYTRVASGFEALGALGEARKQIAALSFAPQDAVKKFTETITAMLAVIFEASDIAADPSVSRAMVALVNFIQGKEFAGQERATASAGFSRGHFDAAELRRLQHLATAQKRAFSFFSEFADPQNAAAFQALETSEDSGALDRMREIAFDGGQFGELQGLTGEVWYEQATLRIDAMKLIENRLTADLKSLCETRMLAASANDAQAMQIGAQIAILVSDADPALNELGQDGGVGLYALGQAQPKSMRSIMDVMQAQSRRLHDVSTELESARNELAERKVIDRAKALLMSARQLSEQDAYALMRKTAMDQHKRIFDVAEAIISMADILKTPLPK